MTDEQRQAAWDRVAAEMREYEAADTHDENITNLIIGLCLIAAIGVVVGAIWAF